MITDVTTDKTLAAPAERVWAAIRGVGGLDRWFPIIAGCRVEGEGVGATRIITLADGREMRDLIIEIDESAKTLRYDRFLHPLPAASYVGTVSVSAAPTGARLVWVVRMEISPQDSDAVAAFVHEAISAGVDGLERELRGG